MSMAPFVPRLPSEILDDLVEVVTEVVRNAHAVVRVPDLLKDVAAEVRALIRRPHEGERIVDDAEMMLVQALEHVATSRGRTREKWVAITMTLLDQVRGDGVLAMEAEARPVEAERMTR